MLTSHDIGNLFASMRTAYGNQWRHGPEAIEVWRRGLVRYTPEQIERAASEALLEYVDHPPNLPQFIRILNPPVFTPTPNTYLPPPKMSRAAAVGNLILLRVLRKVSGVERSVLPNLVGLKNALVDEIGEEPTKEWVTDTHRQLMALAMAK